MSATTKQRHGVKVDATVHRAPHVPRSFHVIDCVCGWQSPLCASYERAQKLYDAHRKQTRSRQSP